MKVAIAATAVGLLMHTSGFAQTRSVHDTATAYGARLNSKGQPDNSGQNRVGGRVENRIPTRLSLRIERYQPESTDNPTAGYQASQNDGSRNVSAMKSVQQQQQTDAGL